MITGGYTPQYAGDYHKELREPLLTNQYKWNDMNVDPGFRPLGGGPGLLVESRK